jgi:hypothetical protein
LTCGVHIDIAFSTYAVIIQVQEGDETDKNYETNCGKTKRDSNKVFVYELTDFFH